jgi:hypothetical protein
MGKAYKYSNAAGGYSAVKLINKFKRSNTMTQQQKLTSAIKEAFDGLSQEGPWMGGAAITRDGDGDTVDCTYTAMPAANLSASEEVVLQYEDIYDMIGDVPIKKINRHKTCEWLASQYINDINR